MSVAPMADMTTDKSELSRRDAASFLRSLADELDAGGSPVSVQIGNKQVRLSPPETVTLETTATERTRRLRKDIEELSLEFAWSPVDETESSAESETESEPNP